ncbi:UNVERIFIED_CONTAM: hypothetical protein RMT77_013484 [Armadillidium vulgare]
MVVGDEIIEIEMGGNYIMKAEGGRVKNRRRNSLKKMMEVKYIPKRSECEGGTNCRLVCDKNMMGTKHIDQRENTNHQRKIKLRVTKVFFLYISKANNTEYKYLDGVK